MALTNNEIKKAKPRERDYKLSDGKGLYLLVTAKGQKYWRLNYRFAGKQKTMALGVYGDKADKVSLAEARRLCDEAKAWLKEGKDPSLQKKAQKIASAQHQQNTFKAVAKAWYLTLKDSWSPDYAAKVWRRMEVHLFPYIGTKPIGDIEVSELVVILKRLENANKVETTHRINQNIRQIFEYAVNTSLIKHVPSTTLHKIIKPNKKKHFAAITEPKEVGRLMAAIDGFKGTHIVEVALKLSPLLFCRPGELRHLEWSEINTEEKRIELPAEKMKMGEPHIIPLSRQAWDLIEEIRPETSYGKYVFPSARGGGRPLSENAIRVALHSMSYTGDRMTAHGFRAMARTLLDEVLEYRIEWIEAQLAHAVKDSNGRAYNRTKHLKQRTAMMQRWADYLDQLRVETLNSNVIAGTFSR